MSAYFVDKSGCSQHTIFPGVKIFTAAGKQMLMNLAEFQPGAIVQAHSHPHEQMGWSWIGRLDSSLGKKRKVGAWGHVTIPGGMVHKVIALDCLVQALDFFRPVREEYL